MPKYDGEAELRKAVERALGRALADDEWEAVDQEGRYRMPVAYDEHDRDELFELLTTSRPAIETERREAMRLAVVQQLARSVEGLVAAWRLEQFGEDEPPFATIEAAAQWIDEMAAREPPLRYIVDLQLAVAARGGDALGAIRNAIDAHLAAPAEERSPILHIGWRIAEIRYVVPGTAPTINYQGPKPKDLPPGSAARAIANLIAAHDPLPEHETTVEIRQVEPLSALDRLASLGRLVAQRTRWSEELAILHVLTGMLPAETIRAEVQTRWTPRTGAQRAGVIEIDDPDHATDEEVVAAFHRLRADGRSRARRSSSDAELRRFMADDPPSSWPERHTAWNRLHGEWAFPSHEAMRAAWLRARAIA